jgi:hypothetical protein
MEKERLSLLLRFLQGWISFLGLVLDLFSFVVGFVGFDDKLSIIGLII